jgi:hypothetical protein
MSRGRSNAINVRPGESLESAVERLVMSGHPVRTIANRLGEPVDYIQAVHHEVCNTPMRSRPNFEKVKRNFNR